FAGNGITVGSSGVLDASTSQGKSGQIELATTGGRIDLTAGGLLDVSGGTSGGGQIVLRAPQDGQDVAIDKLDAELRGARTVVVQGIKSYSSAVLDGTLFGAINGDATAWLAGSAAAVATRLGADHVWASQLQVGAGAVVTSTGDLLVAAPVSLNGGWGDG